MIEVHGWIVIRDCYSEKDEGVFDMETIIQNIQNSLDKILSIVDIEFSLRIKNGTYQISIFGNSNHLNSSHEYLFSFLNWIASYAIGSYGLIYILDDENEKNPDNFVVYSLKKGRIYMHKDKFLSPINPEIEEWKLLKDI